MSRILIHEPRRACTECRSALEEEGHDLVECRDRDTLFDALAERKPDVVVYVLDHLSDDVAILSVLRRAAPTLPLILLGGAGSLAARRTVQELKPTFYAMLPLDRVELCQAVRGALAKHGPSGAA